MSDPISSEDLQSLKKECLLWANNCGGCETCAQFFGTKEPKYDHQETYMLICMIEDRDKRIQELEMSWFAKMICFLTGLMLNSNEHSTKGRKHE